MNKLQIHQFNPKVYPRKLWIAYGGTLEELDDAFANMDGQDTVISSDYIFRSIAVTCTDIQLRSSGDYGVLIYIPCISKANVETMAHEAVHAAIGILRGISVSVDYSETDDEYLAYLVGFCADCFNQVKTNKFKK